MKRSKRFSPSQAKMWKTMWANSLIVKGPSRLIPAQSSKASISDGTINAERYTGLEQHMLPSRSLFQGTSLFIPAAQYQAPFSLCTPDNTGLQSVRVRAIHGLPALKMCGALWSGDLGQLSSWSHTSSKKGTDFNFQTSTVVSSQTLTEGC